jgi:DNA-binding MarR family transcriptional regulator
MEDDLELSQAHAVLDFMLFLNDTLSRTSHHFEQETLCSPEEANIISLLSKRGPLMVKEIAQAMPGIDPSKLTRILDSLEKQGYATRTLNREDRRSFLVTPTEQGIQLLAGFTAHLQELAQGILSPLTSTERLILVELFTKIQTHGFRSQDS